MESLETTEMQKKMYAACGHNVEIHIIESFKPFVGKCINFTSPLDNDPEVASVDIQVPGYSCIYEITEDEIETIIVLDE